MTSPELFLYGDIGGDEGVSAAQFVGALQALPEAVKPVIRIHSDGGSVSQGTAISNAIKNRPGGCTTQIDGVAASMASVIALAGSPCRMAANAMLVIHNVQGNSTGDAEAMHKDADVTDKFNETLVSTYSERTGLSKKKIREIMDAETYLTAREAKELGFVDEITGDLALAARIPGVGVDTRVRDMSQASTITADDKSFLDGLRNFFKPVDPVAALRADVSARDLTISDLNAKLVDLGTVKSERDTLTANITELEAKLKAETDGMEAKIAKEVTARLSAAGIAPINRDPKAGGAGDPATGKKEMSRTDFTALSPFAQSAFCREGGLITA